MTLSGTVTQANLRTDFDANTANLTSDAVVSSGDYPISLRKASATGDTVYDFTAPDDLEVRALRVTAIHTTTGLTVTATLQETNGDVDYTAGAVLSASVGSVNGTAQATTDYRTTTGTRVMLLRGVRYRLTLTVSGGTLTQGQATVILGTRRRTQ